MAGNIKAKIEAVESFLQELYDLTATPGFRESGSERVQFLIGYINDIKISHNNFESMVEADSAQIEELKEQVANLQDQLEKFSELINE